MEPKYTCSPNTLGINTAMFGSAATQTRNSRLLPGLLGHWGGKLGWLVGYLVRCLFAWLVWLLGWFVVWLAGWLVDGLVGYLVRRWWSTGRYVVVDWLGSACFGWLVWLNPPTPGPKPKGPHRGKWEGASL